jgi:DNA-binding transcriptional LysR family regulator
MTRGAGISLEKGDWYLLECFRIAGRLEHMTRAAEKLRTSQPALSRAIARLEQRLGSRVFERKGRNLALTPKARLLLQVLDRTHDEIDEALNRFFGSREDQLRPVAVGFLRSFEDQIVPQIVGGFRSTNTDVDFTFYQKNSAALEEQLENGDLDLIFTSFPTRRRTLIWKKVAEQEFFVITPQDHRLARRKKVSLRELKKEHFIGLRQGHPVRKLVDEFCSEAGFSPITSAECDDLSTIPGFVAVGFGIAVVPEASNWSNKITVLRISGSSTRRHIGMAWKNERALHSAARAFRDYVLAAARQSALTEP